MARRKFYRTIIQVEVLSEDPYEYEDLTGLAYDIENGPCSGKTSVKSSTILTGKQMAQALRKQGSDPEFLQLNDRGRTINIV